MGREIRRVPANWQHPKDARGNYMPLYDKTYGEAIAAWIESHQKWLDGTHPDFEKYPDIKGKYRYYAEWSGDAPGIDDYRPEWSEPADHYQIYETVTDGTPASPVFVTLDEMIAWLVGKGYSEEAAQGFAESGWAPSMAISGGRLYSDIEAAAIRPN